MTAVVAVAALLLGGTIGVAAGWQARAGEVEHIEWQRAELQARYVEVRDECLAGRR